MGALVIDRFCGFSLMELVVTLSIIAVLSAIALPVYTHTKVSVSRERVITRMREIALKVEALALVSGDYAHIKLKSLRPLLFAGKLPYQLAFHVMGSTHYKIQATPVLTQQRLDHACGTLTLSDTNKETISGDGTRASCWRD